MHRVTVSTDITLLSVVMAEGTIFGFLKLYSVPLLLLFIVMLVAAAKAKPLGAKSEAKA